VCLVRVKDLANVDILSSKHSNSFFIFDLSQVCFIFALSQICTTRTCITGTLVASVKRAKSRAPLSVVSKRLAWVTELALLLNSCLRFGRPAKGMPRKKWCEFHGKETVGVPHLAWVFRASYLL
jgi:hypothetical protein